MRVRSGQSRPAPPQPVDVQMVPVPGPEPIGAEQLDAIQERYLFSASGRGNAVSVARGLTGDPMRSFSGDLGPLQGFASARTVPNRAGWRQGFPTALPATAGSGSIQDKLGAAGL